MVEAYLNTKTAGVQTLVMLAQEDVETYVISIVRRPEVLEAAVETLTLCPKTEHITTDWLQTNIRVSTPDPDTTCVRLKATESSQSTAVSIVDAVCKAFLTLERDRVQGEIDRMTRAMKENGGANPTAEQAQAQRVWRRLIASGVFQAVPTVISAAELKNP
jgi:capsular polysaccharide biosynthesis protein